MPMKTPAAVLLSLLLIAPLARGADLPYDPQADARAEVAQALEAGQRSRRPTLLIFGANWCEDCRALDAALHSPRNAALIGRHFEVVKVDVGNWDHNLDISQAYGDPIAKGIPAAVVVSPQGKIVYTTRAGELANARKMSEQGVYDFFARVAGAP